MSLALLLRQRKFWFISVVIIILIMVFAYRYYKYEFIKTQVNNMVASKSDSLYHIHYDSLEVNEIAGNLYIKNLSVTGDTVIQNRYILAGDAMAASMLVDAVVPRIEVTGFKTATALLSKEIACNKIVILRPKITVSVYPGQGKNKQISAEGEALYKRILGQFKQIQADTISIVGAEIVTRNAFTGEIKLLTFNTSLVLSGVLIDSVHYYDTTRTLFSQHMAFQTDKVVVGYKPALAEATVVTFDTKQSVLGIAAIQYNGLQNGKGFSAASKNIIISGLQVKGAIDALQVSIVKAGMQHIDVSILQRKKQANKSKEKPLPILSGWVKTFAINSFDAGNVNLQLSSGKGSSQNIVINKSTINISRFSIDKTAVMDASLIDKAETILLSNQLISFTSKDRMYKYNVRGLRVNARNRTISINEIAVVPQLSETAFATKAGVQKDRYDMRLKNVAIAGINYKKLFGGDIAIEHINAAKNTVNVYRDISKKPDGINKVGQYPHQIISRLKNRVDIKLVSLQNTRIAYKEKNPLSDTSGTLALDKANIDISNITNDPAPKNKVTQLKGTLFLMGSIPLDVTMKLYLDQVAKGGYYISATSNKTFEGSILNTLTVPMSLLRIDAGSFNGLSIDLAGDNYVARGSVIVKYSDLKVSVMSRNKKKGVFDKKGVKSLLANVVVKNSNPKNGKLKTANIVYNRDQYKSIFNMIWKFVFTGLKDIMGP